MYLSVSICLFLILSFVVAEKITDEEYASMPELFHMDNYDHCLLLGKNALYCTITVQLSPIRNQYSKVWEVIKVVISSKKNFRHDKLRHSICVPVTCPNLSKNASFYVHNEKLLMEQISNCYSEKYNEIGMYGNVTKIFCQTREPLYEVDVYDVVVGICFFILVVVVIFCSFYEGLARYKSKEEYNRIVKTRYGRIIACFSIPKNWDRLMTVHNTEDTRNLLSINGIRFYAIFTVVAAHSCMISFATYSTNPEFVETMTSDPSNMLFINGYYTIQTFFLMSGTLLSYYFYKTLEKQKTFKFSYIIFAFFVRYVRLTTSLLVVIAFSATWLRHINRGPLWDHLVTEEYRHCRQNGWTNLLYINNYYDAPHMCLLHSWYLAADTQLFLISLLILMITSRWKKYLIHILGASLGIGLLIPAVINYVNSYDFIIRQYPEPLYELAVVSPEWTSTFISAHTNIACSVIGLIAGYIIYQYRDTKVVLQKRYIVLWWIIVWVLPLSVIFLGVPFYDDNFVYTRLGAAIYVPFSKFAFTFGVAVALVGIIKNIGWLLRDAIVWPPLQILGRLTYSVYLVHPLLMRIKAGQNRVEYHMTHFSFVMETCNSFVLSYIIGLFLCLLVEMPTSALQKLMMPKPKNEYSKPNSILISNEFKNEITKM